MPAEFPIVSLCGSAGALRAYMDFVRAIPADSGMSFVVLTHRRVGTPCLLVQILSRLTEMLVEEIHDGLRMEPNTVYVIPAGLDLTTDGTAFRLVPARTVRGWPDAFDVYLESVARTTQGRAMTVILSGMAKDGSAFLKKLHEKGGTNYAQDHAPIPSMPDSAIGTGMIDFVGSARDIAAVICDRWAESQTQPA